MVYLLRVETAAFEQLWQLWNEEPVSLLIHDHELFYSTLPGSLARPSAPHTAATQLIQGIYEIDPERALWRLRNRIWSNRSADPLSALMIAVAARRSGLGANWSDILKEFASVTTLTQVEYFPPTLSTPTLNGLGLVEALDQLIAQIPEGPKRARSSRKIAAILYSGEGKFLESAISTNGRNRTQHAEINLVQNYFARTGEKIPPGALLVTSLKPCRMCAAILLHSCADPLSIRVRYREFDPGPQARSTLLNEASPDRRRFFPEWTGVGELESPLT